MPIPFYSARVITDKTNTNTGDTMPNPACKFTIYKSDSYYGKASVMSTYAKDVAEYTEIAEHHVARGEGPVHVYDGGLMGKRVAVFE